MITDVWDGWDDTGWDPNAWGEPVDGGPSGYAASTLALQIGIGLCLVFALVLRW